MSKWYQILRGFRKSKNKQILKVTAIYFIWNPEICQDPPSCGQDDLVLSYDIHTELLASNSWNDRYKKIQKDVTLFKKKLFFSIVPFWWVTHPLFLPKKIQCKQSNYYLKTWKQLFCVALLHDMYYTINIIWTVMTYCCKPVSLIQPWWKNEKVKKKKNEKRKKV